MKTIENIIKKALLNFPLGNIIIFESNPDYSCNTYPAFLELRRRLPNYKMVWMTSKNSLKKDGVDDVFYYNDNSILNLFKGYYYRARAKAFISCNRFPKMGSLKKNQISLFLAHGSKTKKTRRNNYNSSPGLVVDYVNVQSHFFDKVTCYEFRAEEKQLVYLGYPRCDWFYRNNPIMERLSKIGVTGDYLIWLPTFRKHKKQPRDVHSEKYDSLGIPLIYTEESLKEFNNYLIEKKLHVIYKPHPVQDVSGLTKIQLSNIHIINDEILNNLDVQLYQVIAESKALISDYSSVYFDYLLLNKPMATTIDDIDQWKNGEGFAYDLESMYKVTTEQIANLEQLYSFIQEVVIDGNDTKGEARLKTCNETVMHRDGHSSKRVADFIINKIGAKC